MSTTHTRARINDGNVRQRVHRVEGAVAVALGRTDIELNDVDESNYIPTCIQIIYKHTRTCIKQKFSRIRSRTDWSFHRSRFRIWHGNSDGSCSVTMSQRGCARHRSRAYP